MPIAPRPNSTGLPSSSNITSYWSNRRGCDPPSVSRGLSADPDTELSSPIASDSSSVAPRRIQTGQNPLSAAAKNFVPQTGQVRWGSVLMDLAVLQPQPEWRGPLY